jgi:hypothetical protein
MRKLFILLCAAVLLLGCWAGIAGASPAIDEIDILNDSGKMSNENINHSIIDLLSVSQGSVTAYTYTGEAETITVDTFSILPQSNSSATNKITRFVFELTNRYRPDTTLPLSVSEDRNTVHAYTYGTMKDEAIWAVVNGLPDCLDSAPYSRGGSGGSSSPWVDKYSPEQIAATIAATTFSVNNTSYSITGGGETKTVTMDVAPYIKDNRTYTPVRYLAYALGVTEDEIQWDQAAQTVTITKDDVTLKLTIGSTTLTKNSKTIVMDVAPELIDPGRTMLPARWVSEALGATVTWDETTQQVTIEISQSREKGQ